MFRSLRTLSLVAAASASSLALAQQPVPSQPNQPGQLQPGQQQPGQAQSQQNQRGEHAQAGSQAQGLSLSAFIAHKLKRGNEAEVELGQMASQRAKNDDVKEFAEMMVKAHTEMIQKLEQLDHGMSVGRGTNTNPAPGSNTPANGSTNLNSGNPNPVNPNSNGAIPQERRIGDNVRNSESNTSDDPRGSDRRPQSGGSQASSPAGTASGTAAANQAVGQVAGQNQVGAQSGLNQNQAGHSGMSGMAGHVPQMLVALTDQACDNELQLTKQLFEKHKGDDFDMAYIGQQIVAHNCMLAHLQAIKNSGPQELQPLVTQGEQATRKHLDQAMKIAADLGGKEKSSR